MPYVPLLTRMMSELGTAAMDDGVQVCEGVLTDLIFVPYRLSSYRPSSQKHRGALVAVAGVPRPRTERQSSSGGTSIGAMVYSLRT